MENDLLVAYPEARILYSRADEEKTGHLCLCEIGLSEEVLNKIVAEGLTSQDVKFTFKVSEGEELNNFWNDHGSHYQMCSGQKLRRLRKAKAAEQKDNKRAKTTEKEPSFTIAGITYQNAGKVKAKARAIMNQKLNGEKLEGYEEAFMTYILSHHARHEEKSKDFSYFIVDAHPEFNATRCFFVVRKDESKEDFSMSKCIENMEIAGKKALAEEETKAAEEKKEEEKEEEKKE